MRTLCAALFLLVASATVVRADAVIFRNGDRLTGVFVSAQGDRLTLRTDALGELAIPLAQVQSFAAEQPVVILLQDGQAVEGRLEFDSAGAWRLTGPDGSRTVPAADARVILTAESYRAQTEFSARPWQLWDGTANLGYSILTGDKRANTLSAAVAAVRQRPDTLIFAPHFRTNFGLTTLFSSATENGTTVSSNTFSTSLRQDYLFSRRDFVFVLGQLDHIGAQGLYLRKTLGGGFGRDLISTPRTLFSLLGGVNYLHEKFEDGASESSAEARAGETLGLQINDRIRLDHGFTFYPNLSTRGQYRFDANATLGLKINSRLSFNTGVIDLYLSNPAPGRQNNNVAFTTGLGLSF